MSRTTAPWGAFARPSKITFRWCGRQRNESKWSNSALNGEIQHRVEGGWASRGNRNRMVLESGGRAIFSLEPEAPPSARAWAGEQDPKSVAFRVCARKL